VNCRKTSSLLSAYMDSELPGVEQLQLREHLKQCPSCNEEYESLLYTKRVLARLSVAAPRNCLEDRILMRLSEETERSAARIDIRGWWSLMAEQQRAGIRTAGLVAVLGAVCAVYVFNPFGRYPSQQALASGNRIGIPAYLGPQMPSQDMFQYHSRTESAQPLSGGISAVPVSSYQGIGR
jgi:predicted anti-sigma-YlaC factor YlaD